MRDHLLLMIHQDPGEDSRINDEMDARVAVDRNTVHASLPCCSRGIP